MELQAQFDLASRALDAACALIQKEMGIADGDVAGTFFADDKVRDSLVSYIRTELAARHEHD